MSDTTVNRGIDVFANLVYFWIALEVLGVLLALGMFVWIIKKWT